MHDHPGEIGVDHYKKHTNIYSQQVVVIIRGVVNQKSCRALHG